MRIPLHRLLKQTQSREVWKRHNDLSSFMKSLSTLSKKEFGNNSNFKERISTNKVVAPSTLSSSSSSLSTSFFCNNISLRYFSTLFEDDDDDDDEEEEYHQQNNRNGDHYLAVNIFANGKTISFPLTDEITTLSGFGTNVNNTAINYNNNIEEAMFHASWLWVNDPKYIHATSGQKLRSVGQFPNGRKILSADIITLLESSNNDTNNNNDGVPLLDFPVSPSRCYHPRGGVYQSTITSTVTNESSPSISENNNVNATSTTSSRPILQLLWDSGEESFYDVTWLLRCHFSSTSHIVNNNQGGRKSPTCVTKDVAIGARDNPNCCSMQSFDYNYVLQTKDGRFEALHEIMEHGAVLIQNAPTDNYDIIDENNNNNNNNNGELTVANLGKHLSIGHLSHGSLYGDVFHVKSMPNANNIAYTTTALPPHQDLTYYESKPFLQLLHCAHDKVTSSKIMGGESVLVDAMAAAEELRLVAPHLFDILCRAPATFLKQRDGADMISFKPHIVTDTTTGTTRGEVVSVNWSPPFEGPLLHVPTDMMDDYVLAYQAMECMLDNHRCYSTHNNNKNNNNNNRDDDMQRTTLLPKELETYLRDYANQYTWEYSLQPGEILVFNNQRMVHARRQFSIQGDDIGQHQRHLIGCYTDAMDTISAYRMMLREKRRNNNENEIFGIRNAGNGYVGI